MNVARGDGSVRATDNAAPIEALAQNYVKTRMDHSSADGTDALGLF